MVSRIQIRKETRDACFTDYGTPQVRMSTGRLARSVPAGLIAAEWDQPARGVPRKYYKITAKGRKRLDQLTESWRAWVEVVNDVLDDAEGGTE